jgi:phosphoribosylaminoimidazole-succinocarboxamide synthase
MGSVKDLKVLAKPTDTAAGRGRFFFSDRYSVFDWGEMPDLIARKGQALALMGAYFFELLEQRGMKTHYLGLIENDSAKHLCDLKNPADTMEVSLVRIIKPESQGDLYNYSVYNSTLTNILIPLEVIYRNSLPAGSSVFKRLKSGSLSLTEIGLDRSPEPDAVLPKPMLDVSTKLEITDRYMSWAEAQQISVLSDDELNQLKHATLSINSLITERAEAAGLKNEDGKVEFAFDEQRGLMLVDVLGTPDECRFTYEDMQVSKEIARTHYRKSEWYTLVEEAKKVNRANWKALVKEPPPHLPQQLHLSISQMYCAVCNEITQREWFSVPPLKSILENIQEQI